MKMSELRENFKEMSCALNDTFYKLSLCPEHEKDVKYELMNSKEVLENKGYDRECYVVIRNSEYEPAFDTAKHLISGGPKFSET